MLEMIGIACAAVAVAYWVGWWRGNAVKSAQLRDANKSIDIRRMADETKAEHEERIGDISDLELDQRLLDARRR